MTKLKFPKNFMWGAATSSHQVEGGNDNDWTEWEKAGHVKDGQVSGKAADHWNKYEQDFDLLEEMNLGLYRFSIEWSRIEPEPGKYNKRALNKYHKMIKSLKKRGIEPMVTLHHFTNPKWLDSWENPKNIDKFSEFAAVVVDKLKDDVTYWCTINEPNIFSTLSFYLGWWPPGKKSSFSAFKVLNNLIKAHKETYSLINKTYSEAGLDKPMVSMAFNLQYYEQANRNPLTLASKLVQKFAGNQYTLGRVRKHIDYIGVNYYFSHQIDGLNKKKTPIFAGEIAPPVKNDLNWDVYAKGIFHVLNDLKKYQLPVIITEAGIADKEDKIRPSYLNEQLYWVHQAIQNGTNVIGYSHWSLLDNFEWAEGYDGRFGLVAVDFKTQKRTRRKSAKLYGEIAKSNSITVKE